MVSAEGVNNMHFIRVLKANQVVYHGSPYKFDEFDLSKTGSGDGNKYGWGIYFTTNKSFSNKYGRGKEYYDGKEITDVYISIYLNDIIKNKNKVMKETKEDWPQVYEFAKNFDPSKYERRKGYIYECSIPDDNELLNYDLPIGQQPQKDKLLKLAEEQQIKLDKETYGVSFYIRLAHKLGSKKDASLMLSKYGVPGLIYEENEKDYVIWDTSKIKILEIK